MTYARQVRHALRTAYPDPMRALPLVLLLLVAGKPHIRWAPSWSDALEEGQVLNLPIVLHRHGFY